ncbi:hypothetical protein M231_01808 [Tremella mesenterica]|uniref:Uncharacterized protein n=1 Tax=Tremella mesenterica TaxID=5217 RepID=A0A4Q1BSM1_TREME|nr:hypothetical protein M231_01808 [Tremella mesenterica]
MSKLPLLTTKGHPEPSYKTFSTRLAAQAYVLGWEGAGRHSLPGHCPRPLLEYLAMSFPNSVTLPSSKRPSYHARLLSAPSLPRTSESSDFSPSSRPPFRQSRSYDSRVRVSSPLRWEVDEEPTSRPRATTSVIGAGGLLSPPASPNGKTSIMDRERPLKPKNTLEIGQWASLDHREFTTSRSTRLLSPPTSPPAITTSTTSMKDKRRSTNVTSSPLWSTPKPSTPKPKPTSTPTHSPLAQPHFQELRITTDPNEGIPTGKMAPKFSRSGIKRSNVVMPIAAPKSSLTKKPSRSSLSLSSNTSSTSLSRPSLSRDASQDRLSTLSETSRKELQLNAEGLMALDSLLTPPRPAFMRRTTSNSSLASDSSMCSLTSGSSAPTSSFESCTVIEEEEGVVVVDGTCTKSEGDLENTSSVESGSTKGSIVMGPVEMGGKKGGMFKRLSKVLKLDKKRDMRELRRPSI